MEEKGSGLDERIIGVAVQVVMVRKGQEDREGGNKTIVYHLLFSTSGVGVAVRQLSRDGPLAMATTTLSG